MTLFENTFFEKKVLDYDVVFDIEGALFIKQNRYLVISDLHFGKSISMNNNGNVIPTYDLNETILKLKKVIKKYKPLKVISLGDNFHDKYSILQLNNDFLKQLKSITKIVQFIWIYGNHDEDLMKKDKISGKFIKNYREKELFFTHIKRKINDCFFEFSGHFHPKTCVLINNSRFYYKCFVLGRNFCILPSFGSYTGGLDVKSEVFKKVIDRDADLIILGKRKIKQRRY